MWQNSRVDEILKRIFTGTVRVVTALDPAQIELGYDRVSNAVKFTAHKSRISHNIPLEKKLTIKICVWKRCGTVYQALATAEDNGPHWYHYQEGFDQKICKLIFKMAMARNLPKIDNSTARREVVRNQTFQSDFGR